LVKHPLVQVHWKDAMSPGSTWQDPDELVDMDPIEIVSVGYMLRRTKSKIVLASSLGNNGAVGECLVVPAPWVARVHRLCEPKTGKRKPRKGKK
jgi:hypothetical protein